ncbi:MAG TPA: division/cell wall cluster transcriptional repressor MraZ [Bacilli bacterium]|nr:division/cell wall cluster transcriptional repressor MraZ [Bacilli bacterium]
MFFGTYYHSLDSKGRLVIPSHFREQVKDRLYVMNGYNGTLEIYLPEDFDALVKKTSSLSYNHKDERDFIRLRLASVIETELDDHGRIALPLKILTRLDIKKSVAVIGVNDHFEVWNQEKWGEYSQDIAQRMESIAEGLPEDKNHE